MAFERCLELVQIVVPGLFQRGEIVAERAVKRGRRPLTWGAFPGRGRLIRGWNIQGDGTGVPEEIQKGQESIRMLGSQVVNERPGLGVKIALIALAIA